MTGTAEQEHERVADVLGHLDKLNMVVIQHVDTNVNFEDYTECTVTFKLHKPGTKE